MNFYDCLYGPIQIRSNLFRDLISTPEFLRLRYIRMVNVDSPSCKDLVTASRFAHTIGVCYLSEYFAKLHGFDSKETDILIAAAALHDMGIPPFGHLVEQIIDENDPPFDHESLARHIVNGTYAPENKYHQIYAGKSLRVGSILDKHSIDRDAVFSILNAKPKTTVLVGSLDLDNIDNVLRMALLLGLGNHKELAFELISRIKPLPDGSIAISDSALPFVRPLLNLRAVCYRSFLYTEDNIAYSALVHDLSRLAVSCGLIGKSNWFLTDDDLQQRLLTDPRTRFLAQQLRTGIRYQLLAAVRLIFAPDYGSVLSRERYSKFVKQLETRFGIQSKSWVSVFVWYEYAKSGREIPLQGDLGESIVGSTSSTAVVALIRRENPPPGQLPFSLEDASRNWSSHVRNVAEQFGKVVDISDIKGLKQVEIEDDTRDFGRQLSLF